MPVTFPLSLRRYLPPNLQTRPATIQMAATTTAVAAALGLLTWGAVSDTGTSHPITDGNVVAEEPADQQQPPAGSHDDPGTAGAPRPHTVRPVDAVLTSGFGPRWGADHNGIDFGGQMGAPISATTDGEVIETGPATGFGLWVRVQQDDGSVGVYGHMNEIRAEVGQHVQAGDVIATVGSRGESTGPHLHYEVHVPDVGPVDPHPWLIARGIDPGPLPLPD